MSRLKTKLVSFKKDTEYFKEYDHLSFDKDGYLVRLFAESSSKDEIKENPMYVPDGRGGFETQDKVKDAVHPYALIIKAGELTKKYESGDLVHVPSEDVTGTIMTPEFIEYCRHSDIKGAKPIAPPGMRENMPKVERAWEGFRVRNSFIDNDESLTFFIPSTRVLGKVNI